MKALTTLLLALIACDAAAYPLDAVDETGIRRLEYYRKIVVGELDRTPVPIGARLPLTAIVPRLSDFDADLRYAEADENLGRALRKILGDKAPYYAISIIDLSDPSQPVYGEHNADIRRNFGSVGKLLVAVSWFQLLADHFPDVEDRIELLRSTWVTADAYVNTDHHKVFVYDNETGQRAYRTVRVGDRALLWEWLDWMLSASNNAAAALMQKQLVLLDQFGAAYPPTPEQEAEFFAATGRKKLGERFLRLMIDPNTRNGVDSELLRQGSLFTREGKKRMPGTNSYGNTREVVKLLYKLERAAVVDAWSSMEIKRLLYMTQKRIRYASHPALNDYAVYYKSGSLYKCKEEPGFVCRQYAGNDYNLLASVGIVEGPVGGNDGQHYIIAVSSNVLRENSAVAHQTLALRIHRMLEERNRPSIENVEPRVLPAFDFRETLLIGEEPWLPEPDIGALPPKQHDAE